LAEKDKLTEALTLSEEIVKAIEAKTIGVEEACLKASRLASLVNEEKRVQELLEFSSKVKRAVCTIDTLKIAAPLAPKKVIQIMEQIGTQQQVIQHIKATVHVYASLWLNQLRFSSAVQGIFEKTRMNVDKSLAEMLPETMEKFLSVNDNLKSSNPEDWANAVHTCRRVIKDLADKFYPPNPSGLSVIEKDGKKIKVGRDDYINRLVLYVDSKSGSETFADIVGSHLRYLGERLDAIYGAVCKGSHHEMKSVEEAERYIVYTYMLVGDILSLPK
jgi:hypothetical protein